MWSFNLNIVKLDKRKISFLVIIVIFYVLNDFRGLVYIVLDNVIL